MLLAHARPCNGHPNQAYMVFVSAVFEEGISVESQVWKCVTKEVPTGLLWRDMSVHHNLKIHHVNSARFLHVHGW